MRVISDKMKYRFKTDKKMYKMVCPSIMFWINN
jgi:hypothetical protein